MNFEAIVFYMFAALIVFAALGVITSRNPVHAVLFLVLAFISSAGIWMLLEAEFLAIALVLVYVGAVMVLFLFVVMMLDINLVRLREGFWRWLPFGAGLAGLMAFEMIWVLGASETSGRHGCRQTCCRLQQHQRTGAFALYRICISIRDRRSDFAGGDGCRDCADIAPPQGCQITGGLRTDCSEKGGSFAYRDDEVSAVKNKPIRGARRVITLSHYLVLSAVLFAISVVGIFLNRKNLIVLLMAIEMMLLAVNTNFLAFAHYLNDTAGQVFVFFILTVAAAEAAIGLAILVVLFRNLNTINVDDLDSLKG